MREIKFRGVQAFGTNKGTMRFGSIHFNTAEDALEDGYVCCIEGIYVDPETVGQLTGIKDINDVYIYEGDVVECDYQGDVMTHTVIWNERNAVFNTDHPTVFHPDATISYMPHNGNVIGNIHENPELLESKSC